MSIRYFWHRWDFFVEMIPVDHSTLMGPALKALGLMTIDKKKHFDHPTRRGIVRDMNPAIRTDVKVGDVVVFAGHSGFTMDGDLIDDGLNEYGTGEGHRWLKEKELLAVEEPVYEVSDVPEKEAVHV